jgi:hypothetical protein
MKTFEEQWTAWLDGELKGKERAEFESALDDLEAAEAERQSALKLRTLLKTHLAPQPMQNAEFFNHQLMSEIDRDEEVEVEATPVPELRTSWWSVQRLFLAGATALAIFGVFTFFITREEPGSNKSQYLSQILDARVDTSTHPNATVTIFQARNDQQTTVLWVEGLESLPSEYAAK